MAFSVKVKLSDGDVKVFDGLEREPVTSQIGMLTILTDTRIAYGYVKYAPGFWRSYSVERTNDNASRQVPTGA